MTSVTSAVTDPALLGNVLRASKKGEPLAAALDAEVVALRVL